MQIVKLIASDFPVVRINEVQMWRRQRLRIIKGGHIGRGFRMRKWQEIFEPEKDSLNLKEGNRVVFMYSVNMVGVQSKNKDN